MKISKGKWKGLQAVSGFGGVIAALAIDQRGALRNLIGRAKGTGPEAVPDQMLVQFKEAVSRILTPHASAILLDPEFGLPAARQRASQAGLLLAYEKTGYDSSIAGRLPNLLDHFSVRRLVNAGADCVKFLLYYSPFSPSPINNQKHACVERIGAECAALDIPFFLEIVCYHDSMDEKSAEFACVKPEIVTRSLVEFSKPQYIVDVFKVGIPVSMHFLEGFCGANGHSVYNRAQAHDHFRAAAAAARKPFIFLSEGVSNEMFNDALLLAAESGIKYSGVLCGRAIWKDGVEVYARLGVEALEDWLRDQGVKNTENVKAQLTAACPWFEFYGASSAAELLETSEIGSASDVPLHQR